MVARGRAGPLQASKQGDRRGDYKYVRAGRLDEENGQGDAGPDGESVSCSTVSWVTRTLEEKVEGLCTQPHTQAFPYLYLDVTFLDARWARTVQNVSALVAYGVGEDGHRHLLAVSLGAASRRTPGWNCCASFWNEG